MKLAAERGWTVDTAHVYVDNDVSAYSGKRRPRYDAMLKAIETGCVDVVVVWHTDRLTRRTSELERYIEVCEPAGVPTHAVTAGVLDLSTPSGRMTAHIAAAVAQMEVEHKAERQMESNSKSASDGEAPRTGRAFGYTIRGEIVPDEAEAVREAFTRFANGSGLVVLADWLNDSGFRNVRGGLWNRGSVRTMLENPRYIAERWTLRSKRGKGGGIVERVWEYVGPGNWDAIVGEDLFRAAATILNDPLRKSAAREGNARKYLGAGCYVCDVCGAQVKTAYGSIVRGNKRFKYRKYACPEWHVSRRADYVDEIVEAVITARLRDPKLATAIASGDTDGKVRVLRDEAAGLRARLDTAADDYADGLLTARDLNRTRDRIERRLADVEVRLAELGSATALGSILGAEDPVDAWLALDPNAKARVIDALGTVRLMPAPAGRRPSDRNPDKVDAWKAKLAESVLIRWHE